MNFRAYAGCSKAEPKISPTTDPFPGARDGQNLISWRWSLPLPTNPVWWGSMHAISSYRGDRPTNTHTNPQTGPISIDCAAKLGAQCSKHWAPCSERWMCAVKSISRYCTMLPLPFTHTCSHPLAACSVRRCLYISRYVVGGVMWAKSAEASVELSRILHALFVGQYV